VLVLAAAVLRPAGFTQLGNFITPGLVLQRLLGTWAKTAFLLGAVAAAFNSIIPIMWTSARLFERARGREADSADRTFKLIHAAGVAIGGLLPFIAIFTSPGVVDMIIFLPAYNGINGLPVTAVSLFWTVNDRETMSEGQNSYALSARRRRPVTGWSHVSVPFHRAESA
jgi:Mn2+/Fe2+ NRAMP family transporter